MSSSNKHTSRMRPDSRPRNPKPMREGENDRTIVRLIYNYRILSQAQLERLMGRSSSTLQRLLRRLYDHRYLDRVFLPITSFGSSPALYVLDKRGIETLRRLGIDDMTSVPSSDISAMFIEHTMAINEFRITFTQACEAQDWQVKAWITESEIKADYDRVRIPNKRGKVALVPDGYFTVHVPGKGDTHFFLELDRGTMTTGRFKEKVEAYISYYRSGAYAKRYQSKGFRVLTIVDGIGHGRVESLTSASATVHGIGRRFWFNHLETVSRCDAEHMLFGDIWHLAGDTSKVSLFSRQ